MEKGKAREGDGIFWMVSDQKDYLIKTGMGTRSCKRSKTLFKSLLFWLAGEVSWLAAKVLSPCQK